MTFSSIIKTVQKYAVDNSPSLLTAVGVTGTITTAFLTGKASFKAAELIKNEQARLDMHETSHPLETMEKVALVWTAYIPAVVAGSCTVTSIVGANRIGSKRAAAMAAAYSISERAFAEYRDKVVEKLGEKKEQAYRDEIAQDRVRANPVDNKQIIITGNGDVLCYDAFSGRYFMSQMETLKAAQNDTNYKVLNHGYQSLSDFYERIGLPATDASEELGWNIDKLLELEFSTTMSEDGRPCISFSFYANPVRNYFRLT